MCGSKTKRWEIKNHIQRAGFFFNWRKVCSKRGWNRVTFSRSSFTTANVRAYGMTRSDDDDDDQQKRSHESYLWHKVPSQRWSRLSYRWLSHHHHKNNNNKNVSDDHESLTFLQQLVIRGSTTTTSVQDTLSGNKTKVPERRTQCLDRSSMMVVLGPVSSTAEVSFDPTTRTLLSSRIHRTRTQNDRNQSATAKHK
jgi:hypothetical protein